MKLFKSIAILVFCIMVKNEGLFSQENSSSAYFNLGAHFIPMNNINEVLKANNYAELNNINLGFGFGGNGRINRFLIGGEGVWLYSPGKKEVNNNIIKTVGSLGYFYFGYNLLKSKKVSLYPTIGVGGGGIGLEIDSVVDASLDQFLSSNSSKRLSLGNAIIHTSLRVGFNISNEFEIDLVNGYNVGFESDWKPYKGKFSSTVRDKVGGFFSSLNLVWVIPDKKQCDE